MTLFHLYKYLQYNYEVLPLYLLKKTAKLGNHQKNTPN